ncbi:MAG: hypothetical protein EXR62_12920 [Chloroflexi bacterium]|nr:hypothetical protein [Chloroflexota bacterium]
MIEGLSVTGGPEAAAITGAAIASLAGGYIATTWAMQDNGPDYPLPEENSFGKIGATYSLPGTTTVGVNLDSTTQSGMVFAKPLRPDEKEWIGKIDQIPGWLKKHPDLSNDVLRKARGEDLGPRRDHPREGQQRVGSLEEAIRILKDARRSRTPEAQQEIDEAVKRANEYLQTLNDILHPKSEGPNE